MGKFPENSKRLTQHGHLRLPDLKLDLLRVTMMLLMSTKRFVAFALCLAVATASGHKTSRTYGKKLNSNPHRFAPPSHNVNFFAKDPVPGSRKSISCLAEFNARTGKVAIPSVCGTPIQFQGFSFDDVPQKLSKKAKRRQKNAARLLEEENTRRVDEAIRQSLAEMAEQVTPRAATPRAVTPGLVTPGYVPPVKAPRVTSGENENIWGEKIDAPRPQAKAVGSPAA